MSGTPASEPIGEVVLHHWWRSSAAYRVRIALALKGIAYRAVSVDLRTGVQGEAANRALNPQGLVPTLEIDGLALTQSLAIVDYLDARVPEPPMVPKDAAARSRVLAMALAIAADIHPLDNLRVLARLTEQFGADQAARDDWYRHWITLGFDGLEVMAADAGDYLSGPTPGIADLCLVPQCYNARRIGLEVERWPTLAAIDARIATREDVASAHPDRHRPPG